jgi:hypothetical protein
MPAAVSNDRNLREGREVAKLHKARLNFRLNGMESVVTAPKNDKFEELRARYAEHCLNMMASTRDQELRRIQREMAAEWMRLADEIRRPRNRKQIAAESRGLVLVPYTGCPVPRS